MKPDLNEKRLKLERILKQFGNLAVAFSGGVDSTFLLSVASDLLKENVIAVTAISAVHPEREIEGARVFAEKRGIRHVTFNSGEMGLPAFVENRKDRCYICKKNLFREIYDIARGAGIQYVAHGANADDVNDYRPGSKAASEMGIVAPLLEAGLAKSEIRILSKEAGLPTWNKPAMACLASRIPYGTPIQDDILKMVAQAEDAVLELGVRSCRVRHHGKVARIELEPGELEKMMTPSSRAFILKKLRTIGYVHIALDLEGYVPGSMNR